MRQFAARSGLVFAGAAYMEMPDGSVNIDYFADFLLRSTGLALAISV